MQHRKLERLMTPVERIARVAAAGLTSATSSVTKPSGAKSYDNADGTRTIIGNVANGESNPSYTMATHVGDVTAPGTPTGVTASSKSGVVVVEWDGTLTGGIPDDFCCVRVYLDNVELGILTGAGSVSSASLEGGTTHSVTATAEDDACLPDGTPAHNVSAATAAISVTVSEGVEDVAAEVEQVRQDVADFRADTYTKAQTDKKVQDLDDEISTELTTNYTNSNDLATTYATKTMVSQTKDAIELAASQTYETQSDAAATYATKSALTVGLDGIRSEVAEDYQPKGDYATTASMNSAIQQSASSIESSVAATYETKSDAAATYATKTEVQQTASGLDTRITTAQSTADGAASTASTASSNAATALSTANTANGNATAALNKVDGLQVGGTNLLWDSAFNDVPNTWLAWGSPTTSETVTIDGINYQHVLTAAGSRWQGIQQNDSKRAGVGEVAAGEKFVFSIDAYGATSTQLNVGIHWLNSSHGIVLQSWFAFEIGTTSKRYAYADLTAPANAVAFNIMIGNNTADVREVWFAHPMLERGTIATDWSPAPEDMATEADLQAEVTERQTLIRQFSGGVLAGYVGNAIAALVNAAGSFDVVRTAWSGGVPSILGTLATFGANLIRIGEETGQNVLITSAGQFFRNGADNLMAFFNGSTVTETVTPTSSYYEVTLDSRPTSVTCSIGGEALTPGTDYIYPFGTDGTLVISNHSGETVEVTYRVSAGMSLYDGQGNADGNITASFTDTLVRIGRSSVRAVVEFCGGMADLAYRGTSVILRSKTGSAGIQSGTLDLYSTTQAALIASTLSTVNDGSVQIQLGSAKPRLYAIADSVYLADTSDPYTLNKEVDMYSLIRATNCRSEGVVTLWAGTKVMNVGTNVSSFTLFTKAQLQAIVGTDWTPTGANCSVFVMNGDSNVTDAMMSASINSSSVVRVHMNKTKTGDTRINYLIVRIGG